MHLLIQGNNNEIPRKYQSKIIVLWWFIDIILGIFFPADNMNKKQNKKQNRDGHKSDINLKL